LIFGHIEEIPPGVSEDITRGWCGMFGVGWAAGKVAKHIAKASGASDEEARIIGKVTSIAVSIAIFDASCLMDLSSFGPQ
jgi:hypothetical protein